MDIGGESNIGVQKANGQDKGKGKVKEIENGNQHTKGKKAIWDPYSHRVFIDLCIAEVRAGNRPSTHFNKEGWNNIRNKFLQVTGKDYDKMKLKNHWDSMKKEWLLWESLVGQETGLGWDHNKKTIDASDDWWTNKIKRNPDVAKFREKGLEHCLKLDELFMDIAANGRRAWAPNSGEMPSLFSETPTVELDTSQSDFPSEDDILKTPGLNSIDSDIVGSKVERKTKRARICKDTQRQRKKMTTGTKLERQLERLVDAVETRSKAPTVAPTPTPTVTVANYEENSIKQCMDLLDEIPDIFRLDSLFMFATHLFLKTENREMFVALRDAESRVAWLRHEQEREIASRYT